MGGGLKNRGRKNPDVSSSLKCTVEAEKYIQQSGSRKSRSVPNIAVVQLALGYRHIVIRRNKATHHNTAAALKNLLKRDVVVLAIVDDLIMDICIA